MTKEEKLVSALKEVKLPFMGKNRETGEYQTYYKPPTVFMRDEGEVLLSAEEGDGAADYYQEFGEEINPEIVATAEKLGFGWEWESPGALIAYRK